MNTKPFPRSNRKKTTRTNTESLMENFIIPKTKNQKHLIKSIEKEVLTVAIGPAGTGKTFCAGMVACKLFITGKIDYIILT